MKQKIIREQWNELNDEQKIKWFDKVHFVGVGICPSLEEFSKRTKEMLPKWTVIDELRHQENSFGDFTEGIDADFPDIGQMIEFLGDDWWYDFFGIWFIGDDAGPEKKYEGELCDALWEAVKNKLKEL